MRIQLRPQPPPTDPTRHTSYIDIAGSDIDRPDLFKPALYLFADNQISPNACFESVPNIQKKFQPTITSEDISPAMEPMYSPFKKHLKRLALPPWEELHDTTKMSLLLWSFPPK